MNGSLELRISEREPFADGHPFEGAGPYERLVGRAHFAVDPHAPAYADVVDLDKVRRNAGGLVEYATDVSMLKPVGPGIGKGFRASLGPDQRENIEAAAGEFEWDARAFPSPW